MFDRIEADDYEQVVFCHHRATGLRAIVAVHSTALGPALGGTRFYPYASEEDALVDVLRLSKGMTYKAALAGLDLGGGKAVVLGDPARDKSEALLRAFARFVDSLGGRYVTAEDVGTTQADMDRIRRETRFVTGVSTELGGSGDPSLATAHGVLAAMRAVARHLWSDESLDGRHVVVSGVGKVGSHLVGHLTEAGARVTVSDVDPRAVARVVAEHRVATVTVDEAHRAECDIFSPCALGAVLDPRTIPELRCASRRCRASTRSGHRQHRGLRRHDRGDARGRVDQSRGGPPQPGGAGARRAPGDVPDAGPGPHRRPEAVDPRPHRQGPVRDPR